MFLSELAPMLGELAQHPVTFMGGFFSGLLRLSLADDPIKSWLDQQVGPSSSNAAETPVSNGKGNGPQSITID
ncbi:MAG TPA: hypothetical protein V6D03_01430 [Candidatus Caenarcaniphilales bacterium]